MSNKKTKKTSTQARSTQPAKIAIPQRDLSGPRGEYLPTPPELVEAIEICLERGVTLLECAIALGLTETRVKRVARKYWKKDTRYLIDPDHIVIDGRPKIIKLRRG